MNWFKRFIYRLFPKDGRVVECSCGRGKYSQRTLCWDCAFKEASGGRRAMHSRTCSCSLCCPSTGKRKRIAITHILETSDDMAENIDRVVRSFERPKVGEEVITEFNEHLLTQRQREIRHAILNLANAIDPPGPQAPQGYSGIEASNPPGLQTPQSYSGIEASNSPAKPSCKARSTGIGFDCRSRQAAGIPGALCPACAEIHPEASPL